MTKKELRKLYLEKRNHLDVKDLSEKIFTNLIDLEDFFEKEYYHVFISIEDKKEIMTDSIISLLKEKNKKVLFPKINRETNFLENILYKENLIFEISDFGIKEPKNGEKINEKMIDIVIIPLLAFDKNGFRVGYGKGFYDKFLSNCRDNIIKIGLSYFDPEEKIDDVDSFDISLNYCITPKKIYKF